MKAPRDLPTALRCLVAATLLIASSLTILASVATYHADRNVPPRTVQR